MPILFRTTAFITDKANACNEYIYILVMNNEYMYIFLSRFFFTNPHDSKDSRKRRKVSL